MNIKPDVLKAAIDEAHAKGAKITGHLCSVGFTEAADMGIDGLEHGLDVDTEFFPGKQAGVCPPQRDVIQYFSDTLDIDSPAVQQLMHHLIDKHVALDSTLAVFEDFGGDPQPVAGLEGRDLRAMSFKTWLEYRGFRLLVMPKLKFNNLSAKEMKFEREFVAAGGTLIAGADPTGDEGTIPGYADQRELELLVKAGFTPVEAIHFATANGADVLGRTDRIGTIAQGKKADLVVASGDPSRNIADVRNVELVFRNGTAYDSPKMFNAVKGLVGVE
jgi:imidazolonepropionase-like amidohydrolase